MSEFILTFAAFQLQLALFGEDESFMNETNEQFRRSMAGEGDFASVRQFCKELFSRMGREQNTGPAVPGSGCPVHGPLSNRLAGMGASQKTSEGNALIFAFAGHVRLLGTCVQDLLNTSFIGYNRTYYDLAAIRTGKSP